MYHKAKPSLASKLTFTTALTSGLIGKIFLFHSMLSANTVRAHKQMKEAAPKSSADPNCH